MGDGICLADRNWGPCKSSLDLLSAIVIVPLPYISALVSADFFRAKSDGLLSLMCFVSLMG